MLQNQIITYSNELKCNFWYCLNFVDRQYTLEFFINELIFKFFKMAPVEKKYLQVNVISDNHIY